MTRRQLLSTGAVILPALAARSEESAAMLMRGVVLYPSDLSLADWPQRAKKAGLTTIALHAAQRLDVVEDFISGAEGKRFLSKCRELDLAVEYELHAMGELLPRELYQKDPTLFRMDRNGHRSADANCCPHSNGALEIIAGQAVRWAKALAPTTHRYFYWPDDGAQWCHCPKCAEFSASEQALIVENHMLRALRQHDVHARLAHLSYAHTLAAPAKVKPDPGIFLEFAPIRRDYTRAISERDAKTGSGGGPDPATNGGYLDILAENLRVFGAEHAQVLEYWLDVSRFSGWKRPGVKLPWNAKVCRADIAAYRKLGIRHITTFATWIDAEYVKLHGDPQAALDEYGAAF